MAEHTLKLRLRQRDEGHAADGPHRFQRCDGSHRQEHVSEATKGAFSIVLVQSY